MTVWVIVRKMNKHDLYWYYGGWAISPKNAAWFATRDDAIYARDKYASYSSGPYADVEEYQRVM